jgi:extracellular elastinolytic metalloproteinase
MKKSLLFFIALSLAFLTKAQNNDDAFARQLVTKSSAAIGLSADQLNNYKVSSTYHNNIAGTQMVYLLQTYKGLPIYNQMLVLAFKEGKLVSSQGKFLTEVEKKTGGQGSSPSLSAAGAVRAAFTEAKVPVPSGIVAANAADYTKKINFGVLKGVNENVTAELMWVPVQSGLQTTLKLAWQVQVVPADKVDYWQIQVNAANGTVIDKFNLNVADSWDKPTTSGLGMNVIPNTAPAASSSLLGNLFTAPTGPSIVNTVNYLVIPFPAESPVHPGGTAAVRTNPWTMIPGNATSLKWHNDGAVDYTISRGNNVWATEDRAGTNTNGGIITPTGLPATSTTVPDPLNFNFPPDYTSDPTTNTAAAINFRQFAITNLFYWNNLMHDMSYQYGFDEVSGNFQNNNQGRGGAGNDYVIACAQSAAEGSLGNNANFATPNDGSRGRMRMYLFNAVSTVTCHVNTPAGISGNYGAVESVFSTANKLVNVGPITAQAVYYNDDGTGSGTHYACNGTTPGSLAGKIAVIIRGGGCVGGFVEKVKNAQTNGAVAVIMVNNVPGGPIAMGGTDNTITIPAVMISDVDGAVIAAQFANNVNITLSGAPAVPLDGDLDAGVMCHEYGHGISTRLTGGPANSSCLGQSATGCANVRENGSEGWSDYFGMMMTTNWATAQLTDGTKARPLGVYVVGQPINAGGIRLKPYSTDMAIDPATYTNLGDATYCSEIHNIGEIWCAAIWDMTWNIIQQEGNINTDIFNASGAGGNSIALKLVVEGLRLQACPPGFLDSRNAILTADANLYGGAHYCAIWNAFARRGMGWSASQGSALSCTDQTPAFDLPPVPAISVQPANSSVCEGANATFTVTATGGNLKYKWQVSTNNGNTWNDVVPAATTNTLTLTSVTAGMNNNQYRVVLTAGCAVTTINSNAAILSVNNSGPVIGTQPANTSVCVGSTATFTVASAGNNTYKWQVSTDNGGSWNDIVPAETNTTLTLTNVTVGMNNNQYRAVVTGGCTGTTTVNSNAAILTVSSNVPISITLQPANTPACAGGNATFTVTATGSALTYKWQVSTDNGNSWSDVVPAATTNTLTLTAVTVSMNNNQYRCIVTGTGSCSTGSVTSSAATLTVNSAPAFTAQPANAIICAGGNTSFVSAATGAGLNYQWQISTTGCAGAYTNIAAGAPYSGVTTNTLVITGATAGMNNASYRLVVTGTCSPAANSNCATLTVGSPATVATQPSNAVVCANSTATFTASGSGTGPIYQWQLSTDGGASWNNLSNTAPYSGVTTGTLTVNPVTTAMTNNRYRLVVSNAVCTTPANSNAAVLTVNPQPTVTVTALPTSVCTGTPSLLTPAGNSNTYSWSAGTTPATPPSVTVTPTITTAYTVTGTITATGCTNTATVTVVATPKPTLTLTAAPRTRLQPGQTTTITATATSSSTNNFVYTWSYVGSGPAQVFSGNTHVVDINSLGQYTVTAADASNLACVSLPATITISDSASSKLFVFPSPNNGLFSIAYYNPGGASTQQGITIYDSKGARVYNSTFLVTQPYQIHKIDLRRNKSGLYYVVIRDAGGKKIKTGEVVLQ